MRGRPGFVTRRSAAHLPGLLEMSCQARLAADGTTLLTPAKQRTAANERRERQLASTRLVIESVFSNLKGQMRLEQHLAKTPAGLAGAVDRRIPARRHVAHRQPAR
jgi:hypothetical protein